MKKSDIENTSGSVSIPQKVLLMTGKEMKTLVTGIADAIIKEFTPLNEDEIALLGIQTKGVAFARRLKETIMEKTSIRIPIGMVDITMYRDDIGLKRNLPEIHETEIPFDINEKKVILVDDVIETGRTIRAALDAITYYGRPALIRLAVLIDRGHREFPIRADYTGVYKQLSLDKKIKTFWAETDGEDAVYTL